MLQQHGCFCDVKNIAKRIRQEGSVEEIARLSILFKYQFDLCQIQPRIKLKKKKTKLKT